MFSSRTHRRSAVVAVRLLFAAPLLATFAAARADTITYNLLSYSASQGSDILSGSITTDGALGEIGGADILGWTFSIYDPGIRHRELSLYRRVKSGLVLERHFGPLLTGCCYRQGRISSLEWGCFSEKLPDVEFSGTYYLYPWVMLGSGPRGRGQL